MNATKIYILCIPGIPDINWNMPRKKVVKDPQDEIDATCKLLCDEAANHMKVRNYTKALTVYQKVRE